MSPSANRKLSFFPEHFSSCKPPILYSQDLPCTSPHWCLYEQLERCGPCLYFFFPFESDNSTYFSICYSKLMPDDEAPRFGVKVHAGLASTLAWKAGNCDPRCHHRNTKTQKSDEYRGHQPKGSRSQFTFARRPLCVSERPQRGLDKLGLTPVGELQASEHEARSII